MYDYCVPLTREGILKQHDMVLGYGKILKSLAGDQNYDIASTLPALTFDEDSNLMLPPLFVSGFS